MTIPFLLFKLASVCIGGERFQKLHLTIKDLDYKILLGDHNLHIKLYTSDGGSARSTQLTCILLLNQNEIEIDKNKLKRQLHSKQVFPHYCQLELKSGENYWLGFGDNAVVQKYTFHLINHRKQNYFFIQYYL